MLARSFLIVGPDGPGNLDSAIATQRQSIPMTWAFAFGSPAATLNKVEGQHYFETTIGEALAVLDRGMAAWNYNSYFRDLLGAFMVFRRWLANYPSQSKLYLNITELIRLSATPDHDLAELEQLSDKVESALFEIEQKHFTIFLQELRRLSYPLVTIPITGDRETDIEILTIEMRDTKSIEAELALQMVGVDRSGAMLEEAVASIKIRKGEASVPKKEETDRHIILYSSHIEDARKLFVEGLGAQVIGETAGRITLGVGKTEFLLVRLEEREHHSDSDNRHPWNRSIPGSL